MCLSSPDVPDTPPPPQEAKTPEASTIRRKKGPVTAGGTLLTSPSGVTASALNTGAPTLLGS